MGFLSDLIREEEGQAVTEYLFILALAVLFAVALLGVVIEAIDSSILAFGGKLENALKSGRAPPNVYTN